MKTEIEKIACDACKREIPKSVAIAFEGADYVYHFCCPDCRDHYFARQPEAKPPKK